MRHITIKARDLGNGHLVRLGASTNYVLVYDAAEFAKQIYVTIYSDNNVPNPDGPTLQFDPDADVSLSPYGRVPA